VAAGDVCGSLYKSVVLFIARIAGLGQGLPEEKPSTLEPLPVRLRELTGKLGWMNWEPMSLTAKVRGGGHKEVPPPGFEPGTSRFPHECALGSRRIPHYSRALFQTELRRVFLILGKAS